MYRIKEAAPDIFMVTRTLGPGRGGSSMNAVVLAGEDGLIFDPGYGAWQRPHPLVRAVREIKKQYGGRPFAITRAMASHGHWDHFSALGPLQDQMGLEILATPKQRPVMTSKTTFKAAFRKDGQDAPARGVSRLLQSVTDQAFITLARVGFVTGPVTLIPERSVLRINGRAWQVIPAPGHCNDDIILYNREDGILLGGDLVLRTINTWLGPPRSDMKTYLDSLGMIRDLPGLNLIVPAHGSPVTDPLLRIDQIIERRQAKARELCDLIAAAGTAGVGFERICREVLPKGAGMQRYLSKGMLGATLDYLVKEGSVARSRVKGQPRYTAL